MKRWRRPEVVHLVDIWGRLRAVIHSGTPPSGATMTEFLVTIAAQVVAAALAALAATLIRRFLGVPDTATN